MTWSDVVTVLLLGLAGVLVGGVISLWSTSRFVAGVVAALALLTAVGAVLRIIPG